MNKLSLLYNKMKFNLQILTICVSVFKMRYNGYVYETFGISESKPVKPLQIKLSVTTLKLALSAKCFIYIVVCWALFINSQLSIYYNLKSAKRSTAVPEKISFQGRQKSGGKQTSSIAIFGCELACANCNCAWLCGLVNHIFKATSIKPFLIRSDGFSILYEVTELLPAL